MFYVLQANNEKSIFRRCRRNCQILWITFTPFTSMDLTMKLPSKFDCVQLSFLHILYQVLPHVFLWRVKDQEDLGGSWQRVSVCGLQLQTDQQDLSRSQEARLIQPEGRPAMDNLCLLAIIWICIFRWSSHGRLVARSLLWTTRRTTGRTCSTAPCSPATGAVAIASNQGRSRFLFRS